MAQIRELMQRLVGKEFTGKIGDATGFGVDISVMENDDLVDLLNDINDANDAASTSDQLLTRITSGYPPVLTLSFEDGPHGYLIPRIGERVRLRIQKALHSEGSGPESVIFGDIQVTEVFPELDMAQMHTLMQQLIGKKFKAQLDEEVAMSEIGSQTGTDTRVKVSVSKNENLVALMERIVVTDVNDEVWKGITTKDKVPVLWLSLSDSELLKKLASHNPKKELNMKITSVDQWDKDWVKPPKYAKYTSGYNIKVTLV